MRESTPPEMAGCWMIRSLDKTGGILSKAVVMNLVVQEIFWRGTRSLFKQKTVISEIESSQRFRVVFHTRSVENI